MKTTKNVSNLFRTYQTIKSFKHSTESKDGDKDWNWIRDNLKDIKFSNNDTSSENEDEEDEKETESEEEDGEYEEEEEEENEDLGDEEIVSEKDLEDEGQNEEGESLKSPKQAKIVKGK